MFCLRKPCFVIKTFRQLDIMNFRAAVQRQFSLELSLQRESGGKNQGI